MQSAASDLSLIEAAAREAGALAASYFGRKIETWSKGAAGPVSEADIAVDTLLRETLTVARPDYGWLSEETPDDRARLSRRRVWIVDPIDGTRAFLEGAPHFTISIGLVEDGAPVAGAVYNPISGALWSGGPGLGARLSGAPIHASARAALEGAALIGKKNFYADGRWPAPWPALKLSFRQSIAHRLALVAEGAFDGIVLPPFKHEWDAAGGAAVLLGAGARVTDLWGARSAFNQENPLLAGLVAAGPPLHALLVERTSQLPQPRAQRAAEDAPS